MKDMRQAVTKRLPIILAIAAAAIAATSDATSTAGANTSDTISSGNPSSTAIATD